MSFEIESGVLKKYVSEDNVTDVVIPDGVISIEDRAFYGRADLRSVVIPEGVTSIGESAFFLCDNLETIVIPDSLTSIGKFAFDSCKLKSVTIPNASAIISCYAFNDCKYLECLDFRGVKINVAKLIADKVDVADVIIMIRDEEFSTKISLAVKYDILCQMFCNGHSTVEFNVYLKKNFSKIFKFAIEKGDLKTVKSVIANNKLKLLTSRNIGNFIEYARSNKQINIADNLRKFSETGCEDK